MVNIKSIIKALKELVNKSNNYKNLRQRELR